MRDPNRGRYKKMFKHEFYRAHEFLVSNFNGELKWCDADYEAFEYILDDVRIVFYPHKTSAWNIHIRVRDGGSKDKIRAQAIMNVIQYEIKTDCTFSQKNNHCWINTEDKIKLRDWAMASGNEHANQLNQIGIASHDRK